KTRARTCIARHARLLEALSSTPAGDMNMASVDPTEARRTKLRGVVRVWSPACRAGPKAAPESRTTDEYGSGSDIGSSGRGRLGDRNALGARIRHLRSTRESADRVPSVGDLTPETAGPARVCRRRRWILSRPAHVESSESLCSLPPPTVA